MAFYSAIMAAVLGCVLSHSLAPSIRIFALCTVIVITPLFSLAVASVRWGLWAGVRDLQTAQERLSPETFAYLGLPRYFYKTPNCFWSIIITNLLIC